MQRRHLLQSVLASAAASAVPAIAHAQGASQPRSGGAQWPARPVKVIVPFPAGSSPDIVARLIFEPLAKTLGAPMVIDNRPGAGGNLGTGVVAKSEPDGYTFLFTIQGPLVTAPVLSKNLNYDPLKDLAPVTLVATSPNVLVVDPKLGAKNLADFVRIAKERKGQLNYGSVGNGSASHLAMELFKTRAGIDLVHVPYQGFPQVVNAILGGQVQAGFMVPAIAAGQIKAGKLMALGVTTLGRSGSMPEMPTLVEQGFPDFEAISWQAVLAPAGTPQPIVSRVSTELVKIIKSDQVRAALLTQYFSAAGTAPEGLAGLMRSERERWGKVIRSAGVQPE